MTGWKIPIFNRKYIFIHGGFFHCHVSFRGCIPTVFQRYPDPWNLEMDSSHGWHIPTPWYQKSLWLKCRPPSYGYLVWKHRFRTILIDSNQFLGWAKAKRKKSACRRFWWFLKSLFEVNGTVFSTQLIYFCEQNILDVNLCRIYSQHPCFLFCFFRGWLLSTHMKTGNRTGGTELDWRPLAMDDGPGNPQMVV